MTVAGDGRRAMVARCIEDSIALKRHLEANSETLLQIADTIARAFRRGNKVLLLGNGGSAADAQHIAGEFVGRFYRERAPLPAIALSTNTSVLTAIGNDLGFEEVFLRQVRALASEGDIVIGISTSGASANVRKALEEAKLRGAIAVAFVGQGGPVADVASLVLSVPSRDTPRIQEAHITAGHIIAQLVEDELFGGDSNEARGGLPR